MSRTVVYLIQAGEGGPIKIGTSFRPEKRLRDLQGGHYEPLRLIATFPGTLFDERRLHSAAASFRMRGEWYEDCEGFWAAVAAFPFLRIYPADVVLGLA